MSRNYVPEKIYISTKIGSSSCVGFMGEITYPVKHGNYCFNRDYIFFANLWSENLIHLRNEKIIDDKIEVLLFEEHGSKYALVVDERVPKEFLHLPYFCGIKTSAKVLRHFYCISESKCLCEAHPESVVYNRFHHDREEGYVFKEGKCPECSKYFLTKQKKSEFRNC